MESYFTSGSGPRGQFHYTAGFLRSVSCGFDVSGRPRSRGSEKRGRELAEIAAVVIGRLFGDEQTGSVHVAMIGGVFRHASVVRQVFYNELRKLDPRAEILPQVVEPVEGALKMARRA